MRVTFQSKLDNENIARLRESAVFRASLKTFRYSELSIRYYQAYHGNHFRNTSLVVWHDGGLPLLWVPSYSARGNFSFFNEPIEIFEDTRHPELILGAYKELIKFLRELLKREAPRKFLFFENPFLLNDFYEEATPFENRVIGYIDLAPDLVTIKSSFRKSFKSLINWGERELQMEVIDHGNYQPEVMKQFLEFHVDVAGKQTRSLDSWLMQGEMISAAEAFVVFGRLQSRLVSASLYLTGTHEAYYGVGVYDRDLMSQNFALAHYPVFVAVQHCKRLGKTKFVLGEVGSNFENEKQRAIAKFKKGFASQCFCLRSYQLNSV